MRGAACLPGRKGPTPRRGRGGARSASPRLELQVGKERKLKKCKHLLRGPEPQVTASRRPLTPQGWGAWVTRRLQKSGGT